MTLAPTRVRYRPEPPVSLLIGQEVREANPRPEVLRLELEDLPVLGDQLVGARLLPRENSVEPLVDLDAILRIGEPRFLPGPGRRRSHVAEAFQSARRPLVERGRAAVVPRVESRDPLELPKKVASRRRRVVGPEVLRLAGILAEIVERDEERR
jgi:hypothetical protein